MAMKKKAAPKKAAPKKKGDEPVRAGLKAKQGTIKGATGTSVAGAGDALKAAYKQGKKDFGFRSGGKNRNPVKNFEIVSGIGMYAVPAKGRPQKGSAGAKKR